MSKALKYIVIALESMGAENVELLGDKEDYPEGIRFSYSGDVHTVSVDNYMGESWLESTTRE